MAAAPWPEAARIEAILRKETVGGGLLLAATVLALVCANSPLVEDYTSLRDYEIGPEALHLQLSLGVWAADGLLAIFFFVVGLELKREFVVGDLRDPRRAALPILAAVGGMVVPALVYVAITINTGDGALRGWAVPTATDIAFALAVLAVIGTHLPTALRTFCSRWPWSTTCWQSRSSPSSTPTTSRFPRWWRPWSRWHSSPWPCNEGSAPGGCSSPSP